MKRPKKVIVLGLDAPMPDRLYKFCKEGKLPALAKIINNGVWAKNVMVPLPTLTPSNWTSIATGAWPGTHGVTDFWVHNPGDALDKVHGGFYSGDVKSEFVWNAIARAGKKSVLVNFPTTWPTTLKGDEGYQIGGSGIHVNLVWTYPREVPMTDADMAGSFRYAQHGVEMMAQVRKSAFGQSAALGNRSDLSRERLFATKEVHGGELVLVNLEEPAGWTNVPPANKALQADLPVYRAANSFPMETVTWHMLVLDTQGEGYDKVIVCEDKDAAKPMTELEVGEWSPVIAREFKTDDGPKKAGFTMKLLELSKDAEDLRLFLSSLCALEGWSYPESLAAEIKSEKGLPYAQPAFYSFQTGWLDAKTVVEVVELERQWFSDACTYVLKHKPWDLFMMHYHPPDSAWHRFSPMMDPLTAKDADELKYYQEVELAVYRGCDQLAADLMSCADPEETLFALVSDHGAKTANPASPQFNVNEVLEQAGLLVRDEDGVIDWSKTKAAGQRVVWVYVNLKGRDPQGIVEPGEEYRQVQEEVIYALRDYVDPNTGKRPVVMALRKEDARFLNMYGDRIGDVVYATAEWNGGEHGQCLPTARYGMGSVGGVFALSGPGIKKGVELERNVWCLDLVPTICYLTGWPVPADAEGAVIYQALEAADSS